MADGNDPLGILNSESNQDTDPLGILSDPPKKKGRTKYDIAQEALEKEPPVKRSADGIPIVTVSEDGGEEGQGTKPFKDATLESPFQWAGGAAVQPELKSASNKKSTAIVEPVKVAGKQLEGIGLSDMTSTEMGVIGKRMMGIASPITQAKTQPGVVQTTEQEVKDLSANFSNWSPAAVTGNEQVLTNYVNSLPIEEQEKIRSKKLSNEESLTYLKEAYNAQLANYSRDIKIYSDRGVDKAATALNELYKGQNTIVSDINLDVENIKALQQQMLEQKGYTTASAQYKQAEKTVSALKKEAEPIIAKQKTLEAALNQFQPLIKDDQFIGTPEQYQQYQATFSEYESTANNPVIKKYNEAIAVQNNLSQEINKMMTPEFKERQDQLLKKIQDNQNVYNDVTNQIQKLATPENLQAINEYKNTLQAYSGIQNKILTAMNKMPDVIEKTKAIEALNAQEGAFNRAGDLTKKTLLGFTKAVGGLVSMPFRFIGSASNEYQLSDYTADSITEFFNPDVYTTETTVAGEKSAQFTPFYDPQKDQINWSSLPDEVANQVGTFAVLAGTGAIGGAMGVGDATAIVLPGLMLSYEGALETGKEIYGDDAAKAMAYGLGSAYITGLTELLMPDRDILTGGAISKLTKQYVEDYVKRGRGYATKQVTVSLLEMIAKEDLEELADVWKDVVLKGVVNLTGGDVAYDAPTINEQLSIISSTSALTFFPGVAGSVAKNSKLKQATLYKAAQNYSETLQTLNNMSNSGFNQERIDKVKAEVSDMFVQLKQVPTDLSMPKRIAIQERLKEIERLENTNAAIESPIIKGANDKKIKAIQGEIEQIMDDPKFDETWGKEVNKEVEQLKTETDAIQKQVTDEGVLRQEGPEVGLQEVVEGDTKQEVSAQQGSQKEEVTAPIDENVYEIKYALDKFEDSKFTESDVVDYIENLDIPELKDAVDKFREEQEYDRELKGRGDMDSANDEFMSAVENYVTSKIPKTQTNEKETTQAEGLLADAPTTEITEPIASTAESVAPEATATPVSEEKVEKSPSKKGFVKPIIDRIQKTFGGKVQVAKNADEVRKAAEGGGKFNFVGSNANLPDDISGGLKQAQELSAQKKSNEEIRKQTGWFKGKFDNKWRYETKPIAISDPVSAKVTQAAGAAIKSGNDIPMLLSDFLGDHELLKLYPGLRNTFVVLTTKLNEKTNAAAVKDNKTGQILLAINAIRLSSEANKGSKLAGRFLQTAIAHEMQHLIQTKEGFSRGSSPKEIQQRLDSGLLKTPDNFNQLSAAAKERYVQKLYESVAGELEARDVANRSFLTDEQRKLNEPYSTVNDKGAFVLEGDTDTQQMSMPDGRNVQVKTVDVDVVNGFYSPLEKIITESKSDKLPAKQWLDKFAKGEEAKWTGLADWLKAQPGSVSKADIQKFLKENRVEIVEVVKGVATGSDILNKEQLERLDYLTKLDAKYPSGAIEDIEAGSYSEFLTLLNKRDKSSSDDLVKLQKETELAARKAQRAGDKKLAEKLWNDNHRAIARHEELELSAEGEGGIQNPTKFSQYQLPGEATNYKEVLVTLPSSPEGVTFEQWNKNRESWGKPQGTLEEFKTAGRKFVSSHFDDPNILVHLRMNTRTDADGNKVLFLEEVQSDWGQKGKKEGFAISDTERAAYEKERQSNIKRRVEILEEQKKVGAENKKYWELQEEHDKLRKEGEKLSEKSFSQGQPSAPFVTDTNSWVKLALKVALKEAVKQGADKIAWTTGEQQNDRYDLSKQVDSIDYTINSDGTFNVYGMKGTEIIPVNKDIPENKLDEYVGKDVAKKIIAKEGFVKRIDNRDFYRLKGDDLKVGGKGMKGFYGSQDGSLGILGNVAKSLFKQEVKPTEVRVGESNAVYNWSVDSDGIDYVEYKGERREFNSEEEAQSFVDKIKTGVSTQPSITITPELKAQVAQGQPLFMTSPTGEVLGATLPDGTIVLNEETMNVNTPMHEAGHLWQAWAKQNRPDLYKAGLVKINGSPYMAKVKASKFYQAQAAKLPASERAEFFADEALAMAIGDKGEAFVNKTQKSDFKKWLDEFWAEVAKFFGIESLTPDQVNNLTLEEFTSMVAARILEGKKLKTTKTKQNENTTTKSGTTQTKSSKETGKDRTPSENKGIGRGRVPKAKRIPRDPNYVKALNFESMDANVHALQYFLSGGGIGYDAFRELFGGNKKNEGKAIRSEANGYINNLKKNGPSIDTIAHYLWENRPEGSSLETSDYREAVEGVLLGHRESKSMVEEVLTAMGEKQMEEAEWMRGQLSDEDREMYDEMLMMGEYWDSLSNAEKQALVDGYSDEAFMEEESKKATAPKTPSELIAKGLSGIMNKIGGVKNLTEEERTTLYEDLKNLVEGVARQAGISIKKAVKDLIQQLKFSGYENLTDEDISFVENKLNDLTKRKKAFLNRAFDGATTQELKDEVAKYGLDYEIESHADAKEAAKKFIEGVGVDAALDAVSRNLVEDGSGAFVWAMLIDDAFNSIPNLKTPEEIISAQAHVAELQDEFDRKARSGGRFISALNEVYKSSDFKYRIENIQKRISEVNNGKVPSSVMDEMQILSKQLEEVNAQLKQQKENIADLEAQIAFDKIKGSISEENKSPEKRKAKILSDKIRAGKINRPGIFMSATPASLAFDAALEVIATSIDALDNVSVAIQKGIKNLVSSDWYKSLTPDKKKEATDVFTNTVKTEYEDKTVIPPSVDDDRKIVIPTSLLRSLIEDGIDNIDDLVKAVHNMLSEDFDDITERNVRDAITKYGKQKFPSKDEITKKLAELKRDGQLLSGLEDVLSGKAPLRSGLQKAKPTDYQRELQRKIKDAMKDLPEDEADVQRKWATANDRIKTLLENRIKDLEKQIAEEKREVRNVKNTDLNEENKALKDEIKSLNAQLDELVGKKSLTEEQRVNNAIRAAEKTLAYLTDKLDSGDLKYKIRKTISPTPELKALRDRIKQERNILNQMRVQAGIAEKVRIELFRKNQQKQIAELQEKLRTGNFDKKPRKEAVKMTVEMLRTEAQKIMLKEQVDLEIEKLRIKNRTLYEKSKDFIADALNIPRSLVASGDLSGLLRQGIILGARHPIMMAKSLGKGMQFAFSEKQFNEYIRSVKASPMYPLMQKAGLYISTPSAQLAAKEEQFMSNLSHKIPLYGHVIKGSERAYSGQLNKLRVDVFMDFYNTLERQGVTGKAMDDNLKSFATFINNASGRGNLGKTLNQSAPLLNTVLFAPRFIASRINLLGTVLTAGYGMPKQARIEALKSLGAYMALASVVLALAQAGGADSEDDPTSSDFGKIKIGNVRFDIWAGFQQLAVFMFREALKRTTDTQTGEQVPLNTGGMNEKTRVDVLTNFAESKLSPPLSMGLEIGRGKYKYDKTFFGKELGKTGDPVEPVGMLLGTLAPIWQQDIPDIAKEEGLPLAIGAGAASFFGVGMQFYEPDIHKSMQNQFYDELIKEGELPQSKVDEIKSEYEGDPEFDITKVEKAVKKATVLYNIKDKPKWYRDVYYAGDSDHKVRAFQANTIGKSQEELEDIINDLYNAEVVSEQFVKEYIDPIIYK